LNPWIAMRGQAIALGFVLLGLALTGATAALIAVSAVGGAVGAMFLFLFVAYRRDCLAPDAVAASPERVQGDVLVAWETGASVVGPFLAYWVGVGASRSPVPAEPEILTALAGAALFLAVVFSSSLIDWFYVTPRRDGLICQPPCWGGHRLKWIKLTKIWILHRLVAEVAFILVPVVTLVVVVVELSNRTSGNWNIAIKLVGVSATLASAIARFSIPDVIAVGKLLRTTPDFALGDTIAWATPSPHMDVGVHPFFRFRRERVIEESGVFYETEITAPLFHRRKTVATGEGSGLYVLDVALDKVRAVKLLPEGGGVEREVPRPATRDLLQQGAITNCDTERPCRAADRCLQINERCERGNPWYREPDVGDDF
jgi:hypothetical protein